MYLQWEWLLGCSSSIRILEGQTRLLVLGGGAALQLLGYSGVGALPDRD